MCKNNNLFTIPKTGSTNHITDYVDHNAGESAREMLLNSLGNKDNNGITSMDFFNLKSLHNDKEIEKSINNILSKEGKIKFDINTQEGLNKINKLLKESIRIYQEVFYRQYPKRKLKTKFNTKQEVINFLKLTLKGDIKSEIACFIAKISISVNEILEDPTLQDLDKKAKYLIGEKILPGIQIDDYNLFKTFGVGTGSVRIQGKNIDFRIRYRGKGSDKSVLKMINDPRYGYAELINDGFGIEFEINSEKSSYLLLNHFVDILFMDIKKNGILKSLIKKFKNKNLLTSNGLNNLIKKGYKFNEYFKEYINKGIEKDGFEDKGNKLFQDAKFEGDTLLPENFDNKNGKFEKYSVELRTVYVGNKNEEGLADHRILDMLKVIFGIIRLSGYIRINEVKKLINILIEKNPDLINKKGLTKEKIFNYYIDEKLIKVKSGNNILYTSKCRFNAMQGTEFYPKNIKKVED